MKEKSKELLSYVMMFIEHPIYIVKNLLWNLVNRCGYVTCNYPTTSLIGRMFLVEYKFYMFLLYTTQKVLVFTSTIK